MPTLVTEAVRNAKEALGDVSAEDLAAYIAANLGMTVKPVIVSITLASFLEKEMLNQNRLRAMELVVQANAEQPAGQEKRRKSAREHADCPMAITGRSTM